ncbi:MAG: hypothetical protein IJ629_04090 [Clostridia bacterium]|nr:hypothetical protein [Clostridia bacterium]
MFYVLENFEVKHVIISFQNEESENIKKLLQIVNQKSQNLILVNQGDNFEIEQDLVLQILWPNKEKMIQENPLNNNSIVCKLNYRNFSILFTGDIEKLAEEKMLQAYRGQENILCSTILKVAHHGSKTSSIPEVIEEIRPQFALIGVGKDNKFGHPNQEVIRRLESEKIKIYRTDINGEILLRINGNINVKTYSQ